MNPEPGLRAAARLVKKTSAFGRDTRGVGDGREADAKSTMKTGPISSEEE